MHGETVKFIIQRIVVNFYEVSGQTIDPILRV